MTTTIKMLWIILYDEIVITQKTKQNADVKSRNQNRPKKRYRDKNLHHISIACYQNANAFQIQFNFVGSWAG